MGPSWISFSRMILGVFRPCPKCWLGRWLLILSIQSGPYSAMTLPVSHWVMGQIAVSGQVLWKETFLLSHPIIFLELLELVGFIGPSSAILKFIQGLPSSFRKSCTKLFQLMWELWSVEFPWLQNVFAASFQHKRIWLTSLLQVTWHLIFGSGFYLWSTGRLIWVIRFPSDAGISWLVPILNLPLAISECILSILCYGNFGNSDAASNMKVLPLKGWA